MSKTTFGPRIHYVLTLLLIFFTLTSGNSVRNDVAITVSSNETNPTCDGASDGSIDITVSGGTSPYTYSWTKTNSSFNSSSEDISSLSQGIYKVTVTDSNSETSSATITLSVEDNQNPTISAPANKTVNTDNNNCTASGVNLGTPSTNDNCGVKSITNDAPNSFPLGQTTVTWTVTDDSNNTQTDTQTVTVDDNQPPTITAPVNVTVNTDNNSCNVTNVNLGTPSTNDNCGVKSITNDAPNSFPLGQTTVTWTVTDDSNNTQTDTQTVTVNDNQPPTITAPANVTVNTDNNNCTASGVNLGTPSTNDNCGVKSITNDAPNSFPIGQTTVTWTVTDDSNNTQTDTQTVTVNDNQPPTITAPANVTVNTDNNSCNATNVNLGTPSTNDNCGVKSITNDAPNSFPLGQTTVTWTVTDDSNNTQSDTQTITVEDNQPPLTPTLSPINNWECGKKITTIPVTTDNCAGEITGTTTDPIQFDTFGEYTINWTFSDPSGNSVSAIQKVIIPEPTVEIPSINGNEFCNEEVIPKIDFTGNNLDNKRYDWSYKHINGSSINIGLPTSGTGNIPEFTAKNNGSEIIEAIFTVIPFGNDCEGEPVNFSIKVKPTPTITKPTNIVVCAGETIQQITFPGASVSGTRRDWVNDNTDIGLGANGSGNIGAFTAINSTSQSILATITLTPTANNCEGVSETFTIEVKPKPKVNSFPEDQIYCNGETTEILPLESNVASTSFNISGGGPIGLSNRSNITEIPSFAAKAGSATVTIIPIANGCQGNPVTYNVTVNPTPTLSVNPASQSLCSGESTSINLSGSAQSYSWVISEIGNNITGATEGTGSTINQSLTNSGVQPQLVKYKITPESNGCEGTPISVSVTVNPIPDFEITLPECVNSVNLTDPSIKSSSFSNLTYTYWNNAEATNQIQNPSEVGLGTYYIKGTSASGCSRIKEILIESIKPSLSSTLTPADICSNTVFNYIPESNVAGTTFSWSRAAVNGISNPEGSSTDENRNNPNEILNNTTTSNIKVTYIYSLTSPTGCENTQQIEVNVKPTPMLQQQDYESELCSGDLFEYIPQSTLGGTNFTWERRSASGNVQSSGSGSISERLNNDTENNIVFTYYYTLSNSSCSNPEEFSVSVTVLPTFQVEASASRIEICPGESIDLFSSTELVQDIEETLLSEDFNSGTNWTPNSAGSATWSRQNNYNPPEGGGTINSGSGSFAIANKLNLNPDSNIRESNLITPAFSTQGYTSLTLDFRHFYRDVSENWGDFAVIDYSLNNGASWNVYTFFNNTQGSPNAFASFSNPISEIIGHDQVRIRFRFLNQGNDARAYSWAIDDVTITGEIQSTPEVEWTSNTDENWTSNEQNPTNVTPNGTTVYTVKYTDPDLECPGRASVEVVVKPTPTPKILANYCAFDDPNKVELRSDQAYDNYEWTQSGNVIDSGPNARSIIVNRAQRYTLRVSNDGCEGTASIDISENLVINGNFDNTGEYPLPYTESRNSGERDIISNGTALYTTRYDFKRNPNDSPNQFGALGPEGTMAVGDDASDYHDNFTGRDHTTGNGNFLMVNGDSGLGNIVWETKGFLDVKQNTEYYFSAWTSNLDRLNRGSRRNFAKLRLQVFVPGNNNPVIESTLGNLYNEQTGRGVDPGIWIEFYNPKLWNSGNNTQVKLRIINEETEPAGNDFGIDDISFAELSSIDFDFDPSSEKICEGENLELFANLEGGREPISYTWTGPNGFTSTEQNPIIENTTAEMSGNYTLTVTDFYGCSNETKSIEVNILKVNAGEDQTVCSSAETIQLNAEILGSTNGGIWSGGSGSFSSSTALDAVYTFTENEIQTGSVELTLTSNDPDATCTDTVIITFLNSPEATTVITNVTCFGANDGTATVNVSENTGLAPFTYEWEDETGTVIQNTQTATGLAPNPNGYTVTVTDANGCTITLTSEPILEPTPLEIVQTSHTNVTCFGSADGTATLEVAGGFITPNVPEYVLSLLDSDGSEVLTENNNNSGVLSVQNLEAGVYTFTANTINGCSLLSENITIDQPLEIVVEAGENITISECGVSRVQLNANPVDPELGSGRWEIVSPADATNASFQDALVPDTWFSGQASETYELAWVVKPITEECPEIIDTIEVNLPEACSKLNFDGVDDYVDAGNHYAMGGKDFAIEAWIKPNSINGLQTIISKRIEGEANLGYDLILNNGAPSFRIRNRSVTSTFKIKTDRWYHIAGVYTSSKITLYVDGIEIQNNTNQIPNGSGNFDAPFLIGAAYAPASVKMTKEHFNGFIEELRIWETPISQEQIRFFMNQRLSKDGSNNVSGTVLGSNLNLPNAPANIRWTTLVGYYQLLAEGNLISSGYTQNSGSTGTSADGLLKNIQLMQENTAPLPYLLNTTENNWYSKTTWQLLETYQLKFDDVDFSQNIKNRNVWDAPGSKGINGDAIEWNIVKLNGNSINNTASTDNSKRIKLLGLLDGGGKLTMEGISDASGNELNVSHYLQLDGVIDLNGESQLVQPEGSVLAGNAFGYLDRDQQGTANSYNYNYWTSPVSSKSTNNNAGFTLKEVLRDGTKLSEAPEIKFGEHHTWADEYNYNSGTKRVSRYWLYSFNGLSDTYSEWHPISETETLIPGLGYTMKGTSGGIDVNTKQNYTFRGRPHNGDISLSVDAGNDLLTGNPYPSAVNSVKFINDNLDSFNGTIYYWDHFGPVNSHYLEDYVGGYAMFNLSGGVASNSTKASRAISDDWRIDDTGEVSGRPAPGRYIPVGQAFFITSTSGGNITFKNSYREYVPETSGNSYFHAQEETKKKGNELNKYSSDNRYKIRLKFESPQGYFRQILVTADGNSTNKFDLGYDAPRIGNDAEDMYWMIDETKYIIQAVPDFNLEQVLPIGIKISEEGEYTIKIEELENFEENVDIFLKDNLNDTYFNLSIGDYKATAEELGSINDRYEIVFKEPQTEEPEIEKPPIKEKPEILEDDTILNLSYLRETDEIAVINPDLMVVDYVELYSISGQLIKTFNEVPTAESILLSIDQKLSSAVYIVKMYSGEKSYSRKVIITK